MDWILDPAGDGLLPHCEKQSVAKTLANDFLLDEFQMKIDCVSKSYHSQGRIYSNNK